MNNDNNQRPTPSARRQYFDIARPGRTPASPTSRPVLASNRPPVKDTSVKPGGAPAVPPGLLSNQQKTTPPPAPAMSPRQPAAPTQGMIGGAKPRPVVPQPRPQPDYTPPHQPQQDVGQTAVDGQMATEEQTEKQQFSPAQPRQEHQEGRHSILSEILAILAIIVLILIILNILVDADIINLPIPHTNLFDY